MDFKKIEKKWQKNWEAGKVFEVKKNKKEKYYCLVMFPYPSGAGLHIGHALNYVIADIRARFKRMQGFNVLHPMGYDALGLPAENAAIKVGVHPEEYTNSAIKNYINQQKKLGLSYDWSRMVNTAAPDFYKWDQWIFLKMLERGIAYKKKAPVNWCRKCETVLANEQVVNGKCWRHEDTDVEIKQLEQWFFKITDYAEELLDKLDGLDWPERTKTMQKNWIGKSYGTEIDFEVEKENNISNVVIVHGSPDEDEPRTPEERTYDKHWQPWIKSQLEKKGIKCETPLMPEPWNPNYKDWKKEFEKIKIDENSILIGHSAGTTFLTRWLGETKKKIKKLILVASWKEPWLDSKKNKEFCNFDIDKFIAERIGEIIIFTSDYPEEKERAIFFNKILPSKLIELEGRGHFVEGHMKSKEFPELLEEITNSSKQKFPIFTTRPDTIYGVTFMVMSAQHLQLMEFVTKDQKKEVENFLKKIKSVSEKEKKKISKKDADYLGEFTENQLQKEGVFTGSYAINPINNKKIPIYAGNFVVADYGSGMVMAVPAHDKRDFDFAKKYEIPIKEVVSGGDIINEAYAGEGVLINSDKFDGILNKEAKEKITKYLEKKGIAKKAVQYKLKDWLVSRQRYWGTPIPIIYCDECGVVPVQEKDLPVKLPKKVTFGKGNPLKTNKSWIKTKCPKCNGKARRETDTMDTFVNSSWYQLRYCDPHNDKKIFDSAKVNYWCPVDTYVGGAEHACMHLIYFRFYTKFLRDLGILGFDEPAKKLFHQGMLHASDGRKMSKSLGNVINPLNIIEKYGADSLRLALMSFASPDKDTNWDEKILLGSHKFLNKIYDYFLNVKIGKADKKIESKLNKTIKEVTNQIENFKYNLAIIKIRELFNSLSQEISKDVLEKSLKLLHPICPHITEELWEKIKCKGIVLNSDWPEVEEQKIDDKFEKEEQLVDKLKSDIEHVKKLIGKNTAKVYVYVMPNELEFYKGIENINLSAVNDKNKHDPENKSKKAKPNKPAIYLE